LPYNPKILELFKNPKNLGKMEDATVVAVAGNPMCGDMITFYLKISNDVIEKASFESYGCAANIASSSIVTEMIKGMKLEDAWNVSYKSVTEAVGGLPSVKFHCGILAVGALKRALRKYYETKKAPSWMQTEPTFEEKQALEEEELADMLSKRMKTGEEK
jgi:NifU-like protein involved in Fe-S cluster formation